MLANPRSDQVSLHPVPRAPEAAPPPSVARAAYGCHLPMGLLVVAGWFPTGVVATFPPHLTRIPARSLTFAAPGGVDGLDDATGFLAAVNGSEAIEPAVLDLGSGAAVLDPDRLELVDAASLGRLALAGAGSGQRAQAAAFMARLQPFGSRQAGAVRLAAELRAFREAVRERPPVCRIEPEEPTGLHIGGLHRIDERSFYVRGWMRDTGAEITGLTAVAPEGGRVELAGGLVRFPRPDVEQFYGSGPEQQATARPGFLGYFELDAPSHLPEGWVFELRNSAGAVVEAPAPAVVDDPAAARTALLNDLIHERAGHETLVRDHAFPALSKLQERGGAAGVIASVTQYGTPPSDPQVTIVVPLYQRVDFLEHQLAQWVDDPDLAGADLIYVLDSPELADVLTAAAGPLYRLYGVPFRTVVLSRNVGFAHANNAGVSLARGRLLLLLNSDVVPDRPGWLSKLVSFYDATPRVGAVGPKLVYEDESIQHAGMYFLRPEGSPWWENGHYFKGLHRSFPAANHPRVVPAVTGACLLISLELWQRVGGLKGTYVQGDYEDSDLCLRLAELGYESWYLPTAELYHLEGQSYPTHLRRLTSRFNTWLHTHLWAEQIAAAMARTASHPPDAAAEPKGPS